MINSQSIYSPHWSLFRVQIWICSVCVYVCVIAQTCIYVLFIFSIYLSNKIAFILFAPKSTLRYMSLMSRKGLVSGSNKPTGRMHSLEIEPRAFGYESPTPQPLLHYQTTLQFAVSLNDSKQVNVVVIYCRRPKVCRLAGSTDGCNLRLNLAGRAVVWM